MDNLRKSIIQELMITLKIPQGNLNYSTIEDEIRNVPNSKLKDFYKDALKADTFGNGMKAIIYAAEKYKENKPFIEDETTKEAKRLIDGCLMMNNILFDEAQKTGDTFDNVLKKYDFKNVTDKSMAILNSVKPYCDIRSLVANIRCYQTTVDAINAFKSAINSYNDGIAIENKNINKMIKINK